MAWIKLTGIPLSSCTKLQQSYKEALGVTSDLNLGRDQCKTGHGSDTSKVGQLTGWTLEI